MIVVESYTKLITDTINTNLPNQSTTIATKTQNHCIYLPSSASISSSSSPSSIYNQISTFLPTNIHNNIHNINNINNNLHHNDRSRLLVILRYILHYCKIIYHLYIQKYLNSPFVLGLLPLLIGIIVGFSLGWWYFGYDNDSSIDDYDDNDSSIDDYDDYDYDNDKNYYNDNNNDNNNNDDDENKTRSYFQSSIHTTKESSIPQSLLPQHIAIIMDGNRRYGKQRYNSISKGHYDGSKTLIDVTKWCIAEGISIVSVYAFSTENWNRSEHEIGNLMTLFCNYMHELRKEAKERGICVRVLSTETEQIPKDMKEGIEQMVQETKDNTKLILNICLSYGSRGEIVSACQSVAHDIQNGTLQPKDINEAMISQKMLTYPCPDPDLVIRTSGEYRLSNFLLWQLAYAEMFFIDKYWPELTKNDLLRIIHSFVVDRKRRYGK